VAKPAKLYTRLPGSGVAGFQRVRLWLGPDHLLWVGSSSIGERYKRFYFADIQALVICQTMDWAIGSVILGAMVVGLGLGAVAVDTSGLRGFFIVAAALFLLLLTVHLFLGQTCVCRVKTAVQSESLPSLKRLRNARKVLARIRPLLEAAQAGPAAPGPVQT
jgi:hypothetical protein